MKDPLDARPDESGVYNARAALADLRADKRARRFWRVMIGVAFLFALGTLVLLTVLLFTHGSVI